MAMLTQGAIGQMYRDVKVKQPVVQIIELTTVKSADSSAPKRVKVKISDGEQHGLGMLNSEIAQLVLSEKLKVNACVRLKQYMINQLQSTKMCIIMNLEIESENEEPIGEPAPWTSVVPETPAEAGTPSKGEAAATNSPATNGGTGRTSAPFTGSPPGPPTGFAPAPVQLGRPTPIDLLNPYSRSWTIKARVISKGDLRTYDSPKTGPGSVFSFDICDESGEMKVTCWRESADRFFPLVEAGKVYLISKGQLKVANKKFSNLNSQYEMSLGYDGIVQVCADEPASMPRVRYSFVPISEVANKPTNAVVDVIGIVSDISSVTRIQTKAGKELAKRTAKIADDSGMSIEITIWGSQAEKFPEEDAQVVAFKGARVTEWNEKSLGTNSGTAFEVNPDQEAATRLKEWFDNGGAASTQSLSVSTGGNTADRDAARAALADLQEPGVGMGDKPSYLNVLATLSRINPSTKNESSMWYASCPSCTRKVVGEDGSGFNCEKCGWSGPSCIYRYMLPAVVCDAGGQQWTTAFNDMAEQLIGKKAGELKTIKDTEPALYDATIDSRQWKRYVFTLRAKMETYQEQSRLKVHIIRAAPVNFVTEGKTLLNDIAKYNLATA